MTERMTAAEFANAGPGPTHKQIIESIRKAGTALGIDVVVTHQSGRIQGTAGVPDLECWQECAVILRAALIKERSIHDGGIEALGMGGEVDRRRVGVWRWCKFEVKTARDRLREPTADTAYRLRTAQLEYIRRARSAGVTCIVGGLDEFLAWARGGR